MVVTMQPVSNSRRRLTFRGNHCCLAKGLLQFSLLVVFMWATGYPIQVVSSAPLNRQGSIELSYGISASGTISNEAFRITYTFLGQAGDNITVTMSRSSGSLDPVGPDRGGIAPERPQGRCPPLPRQG